MKTIFNTTQKEFASVKSQISKVVRYFMAGVLALMMASCNDNLEVDITPEANDQLSVNPTSITFAAGETATKTATVTTDAADWDFTDDTSATWLTVEKQNNTLRFTPDNLNTGESQRSAGISVTAGSADPVIVQVKQDVTPPITYNTAVCEYHGDILGNGAAFFVLDLYQSSNSNIGIFIMGFCTLPSSFVNFKLDAGTYQFAANGAVRTLFPGMFAENNARIGTYLYDFTAGKFTFVTEGSLTLALSGNTYTIAASFRGEDATSGNAVNDIRINFTGQIEFTGIPNPPNPVYSTYTATSTPKWLTPPGDRTWSGTLEPVENNNDKWYEVSNWGNEDISIYLDDIEGKIVIDDYTRIAYNSTHDGYFRVAFIEGNNLVLLDDGSEDFYVTYDPETKKLTFPAKVSINGKEYQAVAGIAGYNRTTNQPDVVFSDFYADVTLQLTPVSSPSVVRQSNNDAAHILKNMNVRQMAFKSVTGAKKANIAPNESGKSDFQKIPLKDLKVTNSSQMMRSQKEVQKR